MLSFLREQGPEDTSMHEAAKRQTLTPSDDPTVEAQEQRYLTVATQNKDVRKTTCLLAVSFGLGLLCLWFMIKKTSPDSATADSVGTQEAQLEVAITQITGVRSEMFNRMDAIVKKFYEFSDVEQVPANELVKNPFELEIFLGNANKKSGTDERNSNIDIKTARQKWISEQTKDMQLLSIMQSDQGNCCMFNIDDRILYEGDSIKDFEVYQIDNSFVRLKYRDAEVVFKLSK